MNTVAQNAREYVGRRLAELKKEFRETAVTSKNTLAIIKIQITEMEQMESVLCGGCSIFQRESEVEHVG